MKTGYHALSLVAVFLALGVGLLMDVAVGDSGLASSARDGLRGDVVRVRDELGRRERFEARAWPALVAGRLRGRRLRLVSSDGAVVRAVRAAVEGAGGELVVVEGRTSSTEGVGVEMSTEPVSAGRFRLSVDNVDKPSGKVALVLLLAGAEEGAYGEQPGARDIAPAGLD